MRCRERKLVPQEKRGHDGASPSGGKEGGGGGVGSKVGGGGRGEAKKVFKLPGGNNGGGGGGVPKTLVPKQKSQKRGFGIFLSDPPNPHKCVIKCGGKCGGKKPFPFP